MKPLAIQTLYFALVAIWFAQSAGIAQESVSSTDAAEPKPQYGGFPSNDTGMQALLDHINGLESLPTACSLLRPMSIKRPAIRNHLLFGPR